MSGNIDCLPLLSDLEAVPLALVESLASIATVSSAPSLPVATSTVSRLLFDEVKGALGAFGPDDDRDRWLGVGRALHATGWGADAFDLWNAWSAKGDKYRPGEPARKWAEFKPTSNGTTIDSIWKWAAAAGWRWNGGGAGKFLDDRPSIADDRKQAGANEGLGFSFSIGELFDSSIEKPEELWGGPLLPRGGKILIAGPPKIGKSALFLAMAVAAATGGEFLGHKFIYPLKVYWLQAEIMVGYLKERLAPLLKGLTARQLALVRKNFIATDRAPMSLDRDRDWTFVSGDIEKHKPDLICVDPAINYFGGEENANAEVMAFLERVAALGLTLEKPAAVAVVHHANKGIKADDPFGSIRGASAFRGWYDSGMVMVPSGKKAELHIECRNGTSPDPFGIERTENGGFKAFSLGFVDDSKSGPQQSKSIIRAHEIAAFVTRAGVSGVLAGDLRGHVERNYSIQTSAAKSLITLAVDNQLIKRQRMGNKRYYLAVNDGQHGAP